MQAHYRAVYAPVAVKETAPLAGADGFLGKLRESGVRLSLVTGRTRLETHQVPHNLGWAFESVVTADDVRNQKPDPEPIEQALIELQVSAERAAMIGDSIHDIHSANAAGVGYVFGIPGAHSRTDLEHAGAHAVYDSLAALANTL